MKFGRGKDALIFEVARRKFSPNAYKKYSTMRPYSSLFIALVLSAIAASQNLWRL